MSWARCRVLVLLVACAALLPATRAQAAPAPATPAASVGDERQFRHVAGWALLGPRERVRGGVVRVWAMNGRSILAGAPARTSATGTFDVAVRRLPRRYVVSVTGGRAGGWRLHGNTLGLVVERGRGHGAGKLTVTPLTTVIAARVGVHRNVRRAERETRRLLKIPAWQDLYADLRTDASAFDGGRFVGAAQRNGGLKRYVDGLAHEIGRRRLAFRGRAMARQSAAVDPAELLKSLAGGVGKAGFGWIIQQIGSRPDPNTELLKEIKVQLTQVNQQLVNVRKQLSALERQVAQSTYSQLVATLNLSWVGDRDDPIKGDLDWLVDHAIGCDPARKVACGGEIPQQVDALAWCATQPKPQLSEVTRTVCTLLKRLDSLVQSNDYASFHNRLLGDDGADGVAISYQRARSALAKELGYLTSGYLTDVRMVTTAYRWKTALLATYGVEHGRALVGSERTVGRIVTRAAEVDAALSKALPNPLPPDTVLDVNTRQLWTVLPNPAKACGGKPTGDVNLWWRPDDDLVPDQAACAAQFAQALGRLQGRSDWSVPTQADAERLIAGWDRRTTVDRWLHEPLGLPDLSSTAAFRLPPLDTDFHNPTLIVQTGSYWPNPGTAAGIATDSCERVEWGLGTAVRLWERWYAARINGVFCNYLRLADGEVGRACVKAHQWTKVRYDTGFPCRTPASTYRWRNWPLNGPVDYGHPLVFLVKRPTIGTEGWYLPG